MWAVRLFKTRSGAGEACRSGEVTIRELSVKPARAVRPGDIVEVHQGVVRRVVRMLGAPPSRVGAKLVAEFMEDLTAPEEWVKLSEWRAREMSGREKGAGRPTKKDRRQLDEFLK